MNFTSRLKELYELLNSCIYSTPSSNLSEMEAIGLAKSLIHDSASQGGIVYIIGNGGSAGIASHFSNDLMKSLKIPSQTLYDSNLMTCLSNDIGYDQVFSYPLSKLFRPQDLLVAISSSGKSMNILNAAQIAQDRNIPIITLSGFSEGNPLRKFGALNFWVNRSDYGLVESAHFFLLHTLIDVWNKTPLPMALNAQFNSNEK